MLTLLLCGCQVNETDLKNELTSELNELSDQDPVAYTTMNKPLYSYYLPKDVGRIQSNPLSSLFMKDGVKFIMNFNPNEVVIHDYYQMDTVKVLEETVENGETALFYEAGGAGVKCAGAYVIDKKARFRYYISCIRLSRTRSRERRDARRDTRTNTRRNVWWKKNGERKAARYMEKCQAAAFTRG